MLNNILFFIAGSLTFLLFFATIRGYRLRKEANRFIIRQSDVHGLLRAYMMIHELEPLPKETQSLVYEETKAFKYVEMSDNKAYWLEKNKIFYTDINEGFFDPKRGKPLETKNLSEEEVNKVVFILNSLKRG